MIDPVTDEVVARRLLERAIQHDQKPILATGEVDDLLLLATSQDTDNVNQWTGSDLNGAAAHGWRMKAGKVAGTFAIAAGDGIKLSREQVVAHCRQMAADYQSGRASVLGTPRRHSGIVSIPITSAGGTIT